MFQFDGVSRAQVTPFWAFGLFFNAANEYVSHLCVCIYRCVYPKRKKHLFLCFHHSDEKSKAQRGKVT